MTLSTIIPPVRSGLTFPVTIVAPYDSPDDLAPMVRSFLSYASDVSCGECDSLTDWNYTVHYSDGRVREYGFDGAEVIRGEAYIPRGIEGLRAAFVAYRDEMHGTAKDTDDDGNAVVDNLGYAPSERKAINRRDAAIRKVAAAMGFSGIKPWKAAGSPVDWAKVRASVKTDKGYETIVRESGLNVTLPPSAGSSTGHAYTASIVRPMRRPGQYQGHSHNN